MVFPGVFKRYFYRGCYVVSSEYTQDWKQCHRNVAGITLHYTVQTFHRSKSFKYAFNVIQNWNTDALQFYSMVLIFLLAVMGEGDENSRLRMAI